MGRGWCRTHYARWARGAIIDAPVGPARVKGVRPLCSVDGCDRPHRRNGLCHMHSQRVISTGQVGPPQPTKKPNGTGHVDAFGYFSVIDFEHPLSVAQGKIRLHRKVLYDAIGPGEHPCNWCGRTVRWTRGARVTADTLVVDHLDGVKLNNDASNLVPSCSPCNTRRSYRVAPIEGHVEHDGTVEVETR